MKILIVEDNADLAQTTGGIVEAFGHDYTLCLNGAEALAKAPEYKPDVIIMDIGLPDISGYDLCRQMRTDQAFARTVFIAQTGRAGMGHQQQVRDAGFHHHLLKPASLEQIEALLNDIAATSACA